MYRIYVKLLLYTETDAILNMAHSYRTIHDPMVKTWQVVMETVFFIKYGLATDQISVSVIYMEWPEGVPNQNFVDDLLNRLVGEIRGEQICFGCLCLKAVRAKQRVHHTFLHVPARFYRISATRFFINK